MGISHQANLVYGFEYAGEAILDKLPDDLDWELSGSAYYDNSELFVICIKKSINVSLLFDDPNLISEKEIVAPTEWYDRLIFFAKENNILNVKIGWYLLVSES